MMKRFLIAVVILLAGCTAVPTPDDFPPPPMTVIVEFPQVTATATIEPRLRPTLSDDMNDAETFFLVIKTSVAAGNATTVVESIKYPIRVKVNGQAITIKDQDGFLAQYGNIFDQRFISTLSDIDESSLSLLPDGVQVGSGELWFNSFCVDLACLDSHFLITQIIKE
jgi:hypothetical protein